MVDTTNKVAWDADWFCHTLNDNMKGFIKLVESNDGFVDILNKVKEMNDEMSTEWIEAMLVNKNSDDANLCWTEIDSEN